MGLLGFENVELEDAPEDVVPICPRCHSGLDRIWVKKQGALGSGQRILLCPHCNVWLGFATTRT